MLECLPRRFSSAPAPHCGESLLNRWAETELISAARYLEAERSLGEAFLDEYAAWEKQVKQFPSAFPEIAPGIRCGYLARFKYHVTYTIRDDVIRILYVRSVRQAPQRFWPRE